jgi:aldose 1-epimerase
MTHGEPSIGRQDFGATPDGVEVERYTLHSTSGSRVQVLTYGGIVQTIRVPDRDGRFANVVLGFDDLDGYLLHGSPHFGATIGRYANRIARGRFSLDGQAHQLAVNDGPNHLHGGEVGFDKRVWTARPTCRSDEVCLELTRTSPAGEEHYPGTLRLTVVYTLTGRPAGAEATTDELRVDYHATTDTPTVVNLTNHSYFNLAGEGSGDVLDHELRIVADRFTPVDATMIPTGELAPVAGTPLDFTEPVPIGARIDDAHEQLALAGGYDHNFVLDGWDATLRPVAVARDPASGRTLEVATTEPGVQLYTANTLDGSLVGTSGRPYGRRHGFALETQHFPDSPNQPDFPSTVLAPGQELRSTTVFRFSA